MTVVEQPTIEQAPTPRPSPAHATSQHEAWETFVSAAPALAELTPEPDPQLPAISEFAPDPEPQAAQEAPSAITVEVPIFVDRRPTPVYSQMDLASERQDRSVVPQDQPAITSSESTPEPDPEPIIQLVGDHDPLDAPIFVAPAGEPQPDSLIDEVDAAFISAGLPSGSNASSDARTAAATLEALARRLREGEIELRPVPGASMSSDESALATVLAALLANR